MQYQTRTNGSSFRSRQRVGKYRIERRVADGGFAVVYQAMDTIEGIRVALKVPHSAYIDEEVLKDFRTEVRLTARLDHPHILPLKNASFIDESFVIVFPLGLESFHERMRRRMSLPTLLDFAEQMISAVAYAHRQRIIHCDIKPENYILFPGNRLRLTDFGIAKVAQKTVRASGTGTVGYMAPEQAMGKPSLRSDVFSLGLILYRMVSGYLPEWPYEWPMPGQSRLRRRVPARFIEFIRKAMDVNPRKRFRDANKMLEDFLAIKEQALKGRAYRRRRSKK
jgi:serine/threonine-protein kinase